MSSRYLLRRAARRLLPRRWLTAPIVRTALGLRGSRGRPIDRVDGLELEYSLDSLIGELLFIHGGFERAETNFIVERLRARDPGAVMIDAGANIGLHSLGVARGGAAQRVIAFEPARSTCEILRRNVGRNGLGSTIEIHAVALSDHAGMATFHFCADDAYSSLTPDRRRPVQQSYDVPVTTLDHWSTAQGLLRLDLVKIDVEGSEPAVIAGARATLRRFKPELVVEIFEGDRAGYSAGSLIAEIAALGYEPHVLRDGVPHPFVRHDDAAFNYYFRPRG